MVTTNRSTSERIQLFILIAVGILPVFCIYTASGEATACFDGMKAFQHLRALVELGPRPPGSEGAIRAQKYIKEQLRNIGWDIKEQRFTASTPLGPKKMANIIAIGPRYSDMIILLAAHYDTKYFESQAFVGANDGASGPAILLELGRCLNGKKMDATIWLVFFDGEEALRNWSKNDSLYGSRYFMQSLQESNELRNVKAMVLFDMVGDADLSIERDMNSTGWLRETVRENANRLGYGKYFVNYPTFIEDDHIPFLKAGIPSLNIIDGHYGPGSRSNEFWHTPEDTLDKVSPESLRIIGEVIIASLPDIAATGETGNKK
jgi:Zn-dependent M28 family amino/carboxypeptidase